MKMTFTTYVNGKLVESYERPAVVQTVVLPLWTEEQKLDAVSVLDLVSRLKGEET